MDDGNSSAPLGPPPPSNRSHRLNRSPKPPAAMPLFRTRPCRRLPVPALLLSGMLSLPGAIALGAVLMAPARWLDPVPAGLGAVAGTRVLGPFRTRMALPAGLAVIAAPLRTGWAGGAASRSPGLSSRG